MLRTIPIKLSKGQPESSQPRGFLKVPGLLSLSQHPQGRDMARVVVVTVQEIDKK